MRRNECFASNGFALLLSSIGVGPDSHPGELPPTELMLLGALAIREAQLSNAVQAVDEVVDALSETSQRLFYTHLKAEGLEYQNSGLRRKFDQERQARIDAEDKMGEMKIRLQSIIEGADALAEEAEDALAVADGVEPAPIDYDVPGTVLVIGNWRR